VKDAWFLIHAADDISARLAAKGRRPGTYGLRRGAPWTARAGRGLLAGVIVEPQPASSPARRELVIVGAGGFAREVLALVKAIARAGTDEWRVVAFLGRDDDPLGGELDGVPVVRAASSPSSGARPVGVSGIGYPQGRRAEVEARAAEVSSWATLIHPGVTFDPDRVHIGAGSVVLEGSSFTTDLTLGRHVMLHLHCTVTHDCVLEDYVSLMPGCHVSGNVRLREGVFMGAGAVILQGLEVGAWASVGAGAVVTEDVPAGATVVGVPARAVRA
jgi:sugar O-acyltransferase (sialic acid O-acetyltransferase NeuD family)